MKRVRFAPSPTGSLHVGNALSAVANRAVGDWMLLRIDDTDPARNLPGGEDAILEDLEWLGVRWDEGPVRQSERQARYAEAGEKLGARFDGVTLVREDGTATYQLATVVDDIDFGITHIVRGNDHRPNEALHRKLFEALGAQPPEFVHHGLILGEDGKKLSKRAPGATVASLREAGTPAEAVLRYLATRPRVPKTDRVFLTTIAPVSPLRSSDAVSSVVARAFQRAGIHIARPGAHVLRHTAATEMLRHGVSLDHIGLVLRHRSLDMSAYYAKVDIATLRQVAQLWPGRQS